MTPLITSTEALQRLLERSTKSPPGAFDFFQTKIKAYEYNTQQT